jgi:hypothetical protein
MLLRPNKRAGAISTYVSTTWNAPCPLNDRPFKTHRDPYQLRVAKRFDPEQEPTKDAVGTPQSHFALTRLEIGPTAMSNGAVPWPPLTGETQTAPGRRSRWSVPT